MTFYEIAELRYINYCDSIRQENLRKSTREGGPDLSIADQNNERHERARRGESTEKVADFNPDMFHPSGTQKVMVYYEPESGKAPQEVSLAWTQEHGEVDEANNIYPDDIASVCFMKDGGELCV